MDSRSFDALARALAGGSRRRMLTRAIAIVAGTTLPTIGQATAARRPVCRPFGAGCTRDSQCCDGSCETRRNAPRSERNRCGCPGGRARCSGVCCPPGQACDGGVCVDACADVPGQCYATAAGVAHPSGDQDCVIVDADAPCTTDLDCEGFCVVAGSHNGFRHSDWGSGACARIIPRDERENGCCQTEIFGEKDESGFGCVDVMADDRSNCGDLAQSCKTERVCQAGTCACIEGWCDHYCASDDADVRCAEKTDGTIIEFCTDGYVADTFSFCETDADCASQTGFVGVYLGGCLKADSIFLDYTPLGLCQPGDAACCAWLLGTSNPDRC